MWILFFPFFLFAGVIENNISKVYKEYFPTIHINKIIIKNFKPQKIVSIDISNINPKKSNGVIKVNKGFIFYKIDATIKVLKSTEIINKNDSFSKNNSKLEEVKFKNFYSYPVIKFPKNKVSKIYIPKNKIIYQYMLTTPNIVERYTPITIISKSGGIEISFQATTLESGKKGDFIKVKDKNNKIFKVKLNKNGNGIL